MEKDGDHEHFDQTLTETGRDADCSKKEKDEWSQRSELVRPGNPDKSSQRALHVLLKSK